MRENSATSMNEHKKKTDITILRIPYCGTAVNNTQKLHDLSVPLPYDRIFIQNIEISVNNKVQLSQILLSSNSRQLTYLLRCSIFIQQQRTLYMKCSSMKRIFPRFNWWIVTLNNRITLHRSFGNWCRNFCYLDRRIKKKNDNKLFRSHQNRILSIQRKIDEL